MLGVVVLRADTAQPLTVPAHAAALFTTVIAGALHGPEGGVLQAGDFAAEGSATRARVLRVAAGSVVATLLCRASVLPRLSGEPAHVFAGAAIPASLVRPQAEQWAVHAQRGDEALAAALFQWAARWLRSARAPRASAARFEAALAGWMAAPVAGGAQRPPGWSERSWQRACRDELGVHPNLLARLARLHASVRGQSALQRSSWAGHALDLGFSDQAHLARDYRLLAGTTPTRGVASGALRIGAHELAPRFFGQAPGGFLQGG